MLGANKPCMVPPAKLLKRFSGERVLIGQRPNLGPKACRERVRHLLPLRGHATQEGQLEVKPIASTIGACQLPVDKHGTTGILAAGPAVVGRIKRSTTASTSAASSAEKTPGTRMHRDRGRRHSRLLRQFLSDGASPSRRSARYQESGGRGQQRTTGHAGLQAGIHHRWLSSACCSAM